MPEEIDNLHMNNLTTMKEIDSLINSITQGVPKAQMEALMNFYSSFKEEKGTILYKWFYRTITILIQT